LTDLLKFRLPGKDTQTKFGKFEKVDKKCNLSGFLVTDFTAENLYLFKDIENEEFSHFHEGQKSNLYQVDYQQYLNQCNQLIKNTQAEILKKCVLSRIKKINIHQVNLHDFFQKICSAYPNSFVYLLSSSTLGTWVGASPEVFVLAKEGRGYTMSLAATKRKEDISIWNNKEKDEQNMVTNYLISELEKITGHVSNEDALTYTAGPVKHLMTKINFDFNHVLLADFIHKVHPTPAVCGFPKMESYKQIRDTERHDRSLYTGIIGWCGENETELFVNLRCARVIDQEMYLFLGGGITAQSDAELEWQETENKSRTLIDLLEINNMNS
jgi:isochorismate synthase